MSFEPVDLLQEAERFVLAAPGEPTALIASRCPACGRTAFPRAVCCPACGAAPETVELRGPAVLDVRTAVLSPPPGALVLAPYDVGVARFPDAGLCVIGLLAGPAEQGDAVDVVAHAYHEDRLTFAFRRHPE
ncbi:hypothetical protein GCM10010191_09300 [Actinomadura vinacea]|uniref:ChsH2 rubredoxin-like zinc ribbon domain-containing protein n=2 Tax=Actinomadura vinacea TaxID=115336 RepID=A0ABP5VLK8_9ACTN